MNSRIAIRRTARKPVARPGRVVAWLIGIMAVSQLALAAVHEHGPVMLRDPEYGARESRLRRWQSDRGVDCVAFGSSRLAEGLRPGVVSEPRIFNFGLVGAGPIMQWLALERVLQAGLRPTTAIFEYWPPYAFDSIHQTESDRLESMRLNSLDLAAIGNYMQQARHDPLEFVDDLAPIHRQRFTLMNFAASHWLPFHRRQDFFWKPLDAWGWLPGKSAAADAAERKLRLEHSHQYYGSVLANPNLCPIGVKAFDELLDRCAEQGIAVVVIWLPESSEFRSWYSMRAESLAQCRFRELTSRPGVVAINARHWSADERLGDGFHLDPAGAAEFTVRLHEVLARRESPP